MKKFYYLTLFLLTVVCFSLSGCHDKGKSNPSAADSAFANPRKDLQMERTAIDTTTIIKMCTDYLNLVKDGNVDAALDMLNTYKDGELKPLSQELRNKYRMMHQNFPIVRYHLEQMNLFSDDDTEFIYMVEFFEKPEGDPRPNTIREALSPVRINGEWHLTIADEIQEIQKPN